MTDPLTIALYGASLGAGAMGTLMGARRVLPVLAGLLGRADDDPGLPPRRVSDCAFQGSHMAQLHSIHEAMAQTARSLEEIAKDLTQAVTLLKVIAASGLP